MTFVLGYDESAGSHRALDVAIELAARFGEPLVLVYGVTPPGGMGEEFKAHEAALLEIGRTATATALEKATAAGVRASVEVVHAKPAEAVVLAADRHDARMIVVGSHGEGAIRAAILGSTSYRVLHQADRPVLVVKG
jgi:nucleotide-binding universal stress UspA family protein